jgi:hypothetical protein
MEAAEAASPSPCDDFLSLISKSSLSISQSGNSLVIGLPAGTKTTTGKLQGRTVKAQFAGAEGGSVHCGDRALSLNATLDPQAEPRTLRGTISVDDCIGCSMEFRAARQPRIQPGATH